MNLPKVGFFAALVILVILVLGFLVSLSPEFDRRRTRTEPEVVGDGEIKIEPPGSKAAAYSNLDADQLAWDVLVFAPGVLAPQPVERSEDGRRIQWDAIKGRTYILRVSAVWWGERLETFTEFWEYEVGPDPDPPDPDPPDPPDPDPPEPPPLSGLAREAWQWAQQLPAAAREQGPAFGSIWRLVGRKLGNGDYPPANDWGAQVNAAHRDLEQRAKQIFLDANWSAWQEKYVIRMDELWNEGRFQSAKDVGDAMREIAVGLEAVLQSIPKPTPIRTKPDWRQT